MNKYEHLLYKRGFLLTNIVDITFNNVMTTRVFKKWNKIKIKDINVHLEPSLQHSIFKSKYRTVLLLGIAINPFKSINDHKTISKEFITV